MLNSTQQCNYQREKLSSRVTERLPALLTAGMRELAIISRTRIAAFLIVVAAAALSSCGGTPQTTLTVVPAIPRINQVDDSLLTAALDKVLQPSGAVNIGSLHSDNALTTFLDQAAVVRTDVFPSRQQLLAYWINVHNAYVLDMLRMNSAHSIGDIPSFKSAKVIIAATERYSLRDISENILVNNFREPRAFFALYDASRSGPPLYREAFSPTRLSDQLDEQLKAFLSDSTKNRLDATNNILYLAPIFQSYSDELEKTAGSVMAFVRSFAPEAMGAWIDAHPLLKIHYLPLDETIYSVENNLHEASHEQPSPNVSQPTPQQRKQPKKSSGGIK